jgi:glucose/arabinose dehydrogenase
LQGVVFQKLTILDRSDSADLMNMVRHEQVETVAHGADLGLTFYTGKMFPKKYQSAIFSAQHGSWNRTVPVAGLA